MRKNEMMVGSNPSVKIAIQSAYKEDDKFIANIGLGMIDGSVSWFECIFTPFFPVTVATGKHLKSKNKEIASLKQFIKDNEFEIKQFAESL